MKKHEISLEKGVRYFQNTNISPKTKYKINWRNFSRVIWVFIFHEKHFAIFSHKISLESPDGEGKMADLPLKIWIWLACPKFGYPALSLEF